jgi:hypothetical protein
MPVNMVYGGRAYAYLLGCSVVLYIVMGVVSAG